MTSHMRVRRLLAVAAPLLLALMFPAFAAALEQKLTASDGQAGFGSSVAIDGDTAVVGARAANGGAAGDVEAAGAVYVFTRSGDSWVQTAKLTASEAVAGDLLGTSVAIDGDTIVAGAPSTDAPGAVYTFARTGPAQRSETAKLTVSGASVGAQLGVSVAIDGDTIVAGNRQARVYTFARTGAAQRTETATLVASDLGSDPETGERNGSIGGSVAIDGDTIVAGARGDSPPAPFGVYGAVYTFATAGAAERNETAKLTASNGGDFRQLGFSVAIDADTIVAGAPGRTESRPVQGSVYTFARTGAAQRTETAQLTASDAAQEGDLLGMSVGIDGDTIVGGATSDDLGANMDQGSVYTFATMGAAQRSETGKLTASDGAAGDELGYSVAIDGDTVIAGAGGSASIFFSPAPPPPAATCFGETATIVPAAGETVIVGTSGADVIVGTDAGESIDGRGGDDLICARGGDDTVHGGRGADRIRGGAGDNRIRGGRGDDRLRGGPGDDNIRGGRGDDWIRGGAGDDTIHGGRGGDRIRGGPGDDTIRGGRGDDWIRGGAGRDRLFGGLGNDRLRSADGTADRVDCGRGRDSARVDRKDQLKRCERVRRG